MHSFKYIYTLLNKKGKDHEKSIQNSLGGIAGIYACGVHGSNRLGGNAVADFNVFGLIAGESAAAYA